MKTKSLYLAIILGVFTWSCSNQDSMSDKSLKSSIDQNSQQLSSALGQITASPGYQVLNITGTTAASSPSLVRAAVGSFVIDSTINTIALADIMGVYNYKAVGSKMSGMSMLRFFTKTADNTQMIVRLPESKVKHFGEMLHYSPADTLLTNDYVISVSKYNYTFNRFLGWDYSLASNINIKNVNAGDLKIQSSSSKSTGTNFASEFAYANGYLAKCSYSNGDTAVSTYSITQGTKILFEEKYTAIKSAVTKHHREKSYSLTIGDVQIIRTQGKNSLDSAKVYVAGVLQTKSKVEIVNVSTGTVDDSTNVCVANHNREIKITFDDGTSSTISQLLGTSVDTIRTLFISLRQTYFATNVVNWIAWDIYTKKQ
jgi:hypothetical protein